MPRLPALIEIVLPNLEQALYNLTVEDIKWYAAVLPGAKPTRKGDLVATVAKVLTDRAQLAQLWRQLTPTQQQVVGEVIYRQDGRYDPVAMAAKYPGVIGPAQPSSRYYSSHYGSKPHIVTAFDLFFYYTYDAGQFIPPDLAARLQDFATLPPPTTMESAEASPTLPARGAVPAVEVMVTDAERAIFHDLAATLYLIQEGKVGVSAATKLPTLPTLRQLRARLLIGDYFADAEYARAEDGMRPLALIMLAQAARWAAPASAGGNKLELTKTGKATLAGPPGAAQVREAWERWLKSDLLDELSRVRAIKGQQSKDARLTKPADRREKLIIALRALPIGRWVSFDEVLRYMRAESLLPVIERNDYSAFYVGSSSYYGMIEQTGMKYWDVVIGSYLRVVVWEYAATLGLVEIAYTRPEESPHDFGYAYELEDDYLSRYDGLLAVRLTNLGAYVLGLAADYTPLPAAVAEGPPLLKVLPNLDMVITDRGRLLPNERAFLERIGAARSEDVYRLSRDLLLDGAGHGLGLDQVRDFLVAKSGVPIAELPPTVRTFFTDLERRLGALREGGRMIVLESDDPLILAELANDSTLRGLTTLGKIGERTVLLVDEAQEAAARRQLKKLGYVPRK